LQTAVETELTDIKNKKKGRNSKNKDKISALLKKLEGWKKVRERAEELTISMDYLEGGRLKELRSRVRKFLMVPEEDETRLPVVEEIEVLVELSEQNRRKQNPGMLLSQHQENKLTRTESIDLRNQNDFVTLKLIHID
jgi:hypothetical protein